MIKTDQLETILHALEGYIQGNDDHELVDELIAICTQINEQEIPESKKDLITITLERDKAKYMVSSFESDLKWLGITSPIDLGACYIDFIKQVKKQEEES